MSKSQYFAAQSASELASELEAREKSYGRIINQNGLLDRMKKSYDMYYGKHFSDGGQSKIMRTGEQGELAAFSVNHYRNLIKHILILTTNQKPSFDCRAKNSDLKSLQQAKLGNNILEAYLREKRLSRYLNKAAELALCVSKGFVKVTWDTSLGRPFTPHITQNEEGETETHIQHEGDIDVQALMPTQVMADPMADDWSRIDYVTIKYKKNKFDLAAKYTDLKDEIENLPGVTYDEDLQFFNRIQEDESCDVWLREFYHKRTPALPNGRLLIFCDQDTVLYDGPIPYDRLPVFRIVPGEVHGTTEGYTDAFDLMAIQEAYNVLVSAVFSNQQAFSVQNILNPEGNNLTADQIAGSLRVLRYNPQAGKPEPLQLCESPKEVFDMIGLLERLMETVSGVNSVSRGNPEQQMGKDASGTALALIQSMTIQFMSGFQQQWAELLEDCGSFMLSLIRDFAKTDRMVALAGKHNKGAMASFTGDDLQSIDRVVVELGNPMSKTTAGRVQMATDLLNKGMVKTPQEYLNVLNSGNLDPLIEGPEAELALMRKENELLMDGTTAKALVGDSHLLHIQEHRVVVSSPELRIRAAQGDQQASQIVANTLAHIQEHMGLYKSQDPLWSQVAGEPPAPPQGPPPGPPQGPQGPQGPGPHGPGPGPIPPIQDPNQPPNLPSPAQPPQMGPAPVPGIGLQ